AWRGRLCHHRPTADDTGLCARPHAGQCQLAVPRHRACRPAGHAALWRTPVARWGAGHGPDRGRRHGLDPAETGCTTERNIRRRQALRLRRRSMTVVVLVVMLVVM